MLSFQTYSSWIPLALVTIALGGLMCNALKCSQHFRMQAGRCERCRYAGRCGVGEFQPVCLGNATHYPACRPCTNKPVGDSSSYTSSAIGSSRCDWECHAGSFPLVKNVTGTRETECRPCPPAPENGFYMPISGRKAAARAHYQPEPDASAEAFERFFGLPHDTNDGKAQCAHAVQCTAGFYLNQSDTMGPQCLDCGKPQCKLTERLQPCRRHSPSLCVSI